MNFISVEELNSAAKDAQKLIFTGEKTYSERITAAAEMIYKNRTRCPVVLISGPSGSGKTSSASRVARILNDMGCVTHAISMDNYFLPMSDSMDNVILDEEGKIDYESPYRLDIDMFREHLRKLSNLEEIDIPSFDFASQKRKKGFKLKTSKGDLVILEGIHALNPLVTGSSDDYTTRVYVSVRTRMEYNGEFLHPSKIRLMRRLIRDSLYRGRSADQTFEFFKSVERGENLYVMPFKNRADCDIDTFISYEPMVYKNILLPILEKASVTYPDYNRFSDIERFLKTIAPINEKFVPGNSLLKEFIG